MSERAPNRLIHEKSPYLLQHAHNPVDWRPWGEAAFEEARELDKPIFLSIGYSTCHWCHVMERESFEDEEVAAAMNAAFVPIKVDREERPDVDAVYMTTCQLMTGKGGWPMSIVMTPDKRPFFAATYIPKDNRYGSMGLLDLCKRIADIWISRRQEVAASADKVADILGAMDRRKEGAPVQDLSEALLEAGFRELLGRFDKIHGGFGTAPKFPSPHTLLFLLRFHRRNGHPAALEMVEKSLEAMRLGGMYDHVGFGFHRYSTDQEFLLPHFEKMLYDQAMLLMACAEAWQAGGRELFATTAREVVEYLLRDMTHPEGGFFCAEDADSEGEEGKFYVWTWEEWTRVLGDEAEPMARLFGVAPGGNFADESTGERIAANIPHLMAPLEKAAQESGVEVRAMTARVEAARKRLFETREKRVRPHKDDKILADWNGLMIAALAKTARTFRADAEFSEKCEQAAERAALFILEKLGQPDGTLLHRWREGQAAIPGHLDDYAFMIWGLVELHQASLDGRWLAEAEKLAGVMLARFRDQKSGGLYLTADSSEKLLYRPKEVYDGAAPSGNSVAALALVKLARLTARADLEDAAAGVLTAFALDMSMNPSAHCMLLCALDFVLGPSWKVMLSGDPESPRMAAFIETALAGYSPDVLLSLAPPGLAAASSQVTAQACKDVHCLPPAESPDILAEQLAGRRDG